MASSLVGSNIWGQHQYRIDRMINEEQLGKVYEATRMGDEVIVDLKVLHPHLANSKEVLARFHREMVATASLNHPNSVAMLDFGEDRSFHYLVLEHIDGNPLSTILRAQRSLAPEVAAHVAAQICSVLHAAHSAQIIHRNLSTDNVLLVPADGGTFLVKVRDFGLSRLMDPDADEQVTAVGMRVGDAGYMAPEYIADGLVDHRGDLYAVGVLLFEMATGRKPFEASNKGLVLDMHVDQVPPRPSEQNPNIPAWMDELIMDLLAKTPDRRPEDGATVIARLEAGVGHRLGVPSVGGVVPGDPTGAAAGSSTSKLPWILMGLLVLGGIGIGVLIALFIAFQMMS